MRPKNLSRDMGMRASLIEHKQIIATIAARKRRWPSM